MMKKRAVLFDLDGTLMDTLEDLTDSINHVMLENGMASRTVPEIRSFVGNGIRKLVERSVPAETDEQTIDKCFREMLAYYRTHSIIKTAPYAGTIELLRKLDSLGIKKAVITNKVQSAADEIAERFFPGLIDIVVGDDGKMPLKPQPDGIFKAAAALNCSIADSVYVGDSEVDARTAAGASVDFIGVLWGFRTREVLVDNGAVNFAGDCRELYEMLAGKTF